MREFDFTFDEGMRVGIRPYRAPVNTQSFIVLKNARIGKYGLMPLTDISEVFTHPRPETYPDMSQDWPFPQYFYGGRVRCLGLRKTFYEINADGTFTPVIIDVDNVQTDDLWDVADFGKYQLVMKDGNFVVEKAGDTGVWTKSNVSATIPNAKTVDNFKGQAVVGNLDFADWSDADDSYVGWSKIGSASFVNDRMNIAGYMPTLFDGPVYNVRRLGNMVIVYGLNGINILSPVQTPAPTFGFDSFMKTGLINKGAVGGNKNAHCFVGTDRILYKILADGSVNQLGYNEQLSTMNLPIIVAHVPGGEGEDVGVFYIGDGTTSYVLTSYGLSQTHQKVTAAHRIDGTPTGFFESDGDTNFLAVTDVVDFDTRGQKTINTLEVGCNGSGSYSVAVDYRHETTGAFGTTQFVPLNDKGIANLICNGTEFRFRLTYDNPSDLDISYIKVRYRLDDFRSVRDYREPRVRR